MTPSQWMTVLTLLAANGAAAQSNVRNPLPTEIRAMSGQQAPGTGGASFTFMSHPAVDGDGVLSFVTLLSGPEISSVNDFSIWRSTPGGLLMLGQENEVLPESPGNTLRTFSDAHTLSRDGTGTFSGSVRQIDQPDNVRAAIWLTGAAGRSLVVREGDPAPGIPGGFFASIRSPSAAHDVWGAFRGIVAAPESREIIGLWRFDNTGGLSLVERTGAIVPGTNGAQLDDLSDPSIASTGDVAVTGFLKNREAAPSEGIDEINRDNERCAIVVRPSGTQLLAREGDPAPGVPGRTFQEVSVNAISDRGDVTITGNISHDRGVWVWRDGVLSAVVYPGMPIDPTEPTVVHQVNASTMNSRGVIVMQAQLFPDPNNEDIAETAILTDDHGDLTVVARTGDPAPTAEQHTFWQFGAPAINEHGDLSFVASVVRALPDGTKEYTSGIWLYDAALRRVLPVCREETLFDVSDDQDGSDLRTVQYILYDHQSGDGSSGLGSARQIGYVVGFVDGSNALAVSTLPEATLCAGDCDNSGSVDFSDLIATLFLFGSDDPSPGCDANADGVTSFDDLITTLFLFGPCDG